MSSKKIQSTRNYSLFTRHSGENRPLDLKKHRKLMVSMKLYGFLVCFPIVCCRDKSGNLVIKDGQHRYAIAQEFGLPIHWVEEDVDFDVAIVNSAAKGWALKDYAQKHAANGLKAYQEGIEFCEQHNLQFGTAFALLAGTTGFTNIRNQFIDGTFKIKDRAWADSVAGIYGPFVLLSPHVKTARFIEACMAVCRVREFEPKRLLANAERCREKLVAFSTREAYLDMLESVYNFGRVKLVGLKAAAMMAMRERSAVNQPKKSDAKDIAA